MRKIAFKNLRQIIIKVTLPARGPDEARRFALLNADQQGERESALEEIFCKLTC